MSNIRQLRPIAGHLLYYGQDSSFRTPVLQSAGFKVRRCSSPAELPALLRAPLDAVLVPQLEDELTEEVATLTWAHSPAALVCFSEPRRFVGGLGSVEAYFDLIIPWQTPPRLWLGEISALLGKTRTLLLENRELRRQAAEVRQNSVNLREASARARAQRLALLKQRNDWGE